MPAKKDFVPDSWKNLRDWAQNILENITAQLIGVEGWDPARTAGFVARVTQVRDRAQAILNAQAALEAEIGALDTVLDVELPEVRQDIGNMKKSRGWNDGKGDVLEVNTPAASIDPDTLQPKLDAEGKKGRVELMGRKLGADSLNIYVRRAGEAAFRLLAAKRVRFPLDDDAPPAAAVIGDDEIGVPTDIVSAVWRP